MKPTPKEIVRVFRALSDSTRVEIVRLVAKAPRNVSELTSLVQVTQPKVSRHLKILRDAGLLTDVRRGKWVWYELAAPVRGNPGGAVLEAVVPLLSGSGRAVYGGPEAPGGGHAHPRSVGSGGEAAGRSARLTGGKGGRPISEGMSNLAPGGRERDGSSDAAVAGGPPAGRAASAMRPSAAARGASVKRPHTAGRTKPARPAQSRRQTKGPVQAGKSRSPASRKAKKRIVTPEVKPPRKDIEDFLL